SGLALLPQGIMMGLSTKLGDEIGKRGRRRAGIVFGLAAVAVTTASLLFITATTPLWVTALLMTGRGLGIGLVIQPLLTSVLVDLAERELADATTLFSVGRRLGGSVGVSLLATSFPLRVTARIGAVLVAAGIPASAIGKPGVGSLASAPATLRA